MPHSNQVVFALTSPGRDRYSAMTRVAAASLRHSNPTLRIVVACDAQSDRQLRDADDPLRGEVDGWRVVATPAGEAAWRNRSVKTRLRCELDDAFLFLDSDVFVRDDLAELFAIRNDFAAARNHSRPAHGEQIWQGDRETLAALGWAVRGDVYVNGGVAFWNATEGSRRLAEDWHRRWQQSCDATGGHRDQPALNAAIASTAPSITLLRDRFNAQVSANPTAAHGAAIWHFYASDASASGFEFDAIVDEVQRSGRVDRGRIAALAASLSPWRER